MSEIPIGKRMCESNNNAKDYALRNADDFRNLLQHRIAETHREGASLLPGSPPHAPEGA